MGQQSNKIIKRRRRADYLKRKEEQAKLNGLLPKTKVKKADPKAAPGEKPAAAPAKKAAAKKAPAKKAAKKAPAKKAAKSDESSES
jgi:hypothetical protein